MRDATVRVTFYLSRLQITNSCEIRRNGRWKMTVIRFGNESLMSWKTLCLRRVTVIKLATIHFILLLLDKSRIKKLRLSFGFIKRIS